ncbi:MAG: hypothetical protein E5V64_22265 [Mesorhizobium sp.]|uniref:hypothetical protein n=1 Tax=Mesorhizobium sp. TaxID=1871066 RepID=UPI0012032D74|nr:hypothetical protein [Mesorhizobium sp.]TIV79802.1 MAG: hypothetical protein E5V64_22265 [Mesorhizobium sp.]
MELNYDFEFQSIFPKAVWLVPECKRLLDEVGIAHNVQGNHVPAFVDPATIVALRREPDKIRTMMLGAGWSLLPYEGEASPEKAQFLIPQLLEIHAKAESRAYDAHAAKYAVFDLFGFTKKLTMGEIIGADGSPTCSELTRQRMQGARPASSFEIYKALMAMAGDERNHPAAEPAAPPPPVKPAAPTSGPFARVARVFGRRQN